MISRTILSYKSPLIGRTVLPYKSPIRNFAKKNPAKLKAIIAARRAAVDYLYAEPEKAAKLIAKAYGKKVSEEVAIIAVKNMVKINYWGRGKFDLPALEAMLDGLRAQGSWEGPIDWNKILDDSFLPDDQKG